jgi:hypothetical protein
MQGWNVYLHSKCIDTVFYDSDCDADYVQRGLVVHDGYHPAITVRRSHPRETSPALSRRDPAFPRGAK